MNDSQEQDLLQCWQESAPGGLDPSKLARTMGSRVAQFDRKIFWRNLAEYAAGAVLLPVGAYGAWHGEIYGILMVVCVSFVLGYLWWQHRGQRALDPSSDARAYQRAMLARIDHQIRLLGRVRYWYLLPLYIPVLWQAIETWPKRPLSAAMALVIVTAAFVFVGWLNEKMAVQKLTQARAIWVRMLDDKS